MSRCPWGEGRLPEAAKARKLQTEEEWKAEKLGHLVGFRHSHAPNQVTGNMVDLIFSEHNRGNVIEAVASMSGWKLYWRRVMTEQEKEHLRKLLQQMAVINRVMSSDSVVQVIHQFLFCFLMSYLSDQILEYRRYCLDCYISVLETFPWVQVNTN